MTREQAIEIIKANWPDSSNSFSGLRDALSIAIAALRAEPPAPADLVVQDTPRVTVEADWATQPDWGVTVYAVADCVFTTCPHPDTCKGLELGCAILKRQSQAGGR